MSSGVGYGKPPTEHRFRPGRTGNPGGRPKGLARKLREILGDDGDMLVEFWISAVRDGYVVNRHPQTGEYAHEKVSVRDRIAISKLLADRAFGKAPDVVVIEDDDPPEVGIDDNRVAEDLERFLGVIHERRRRREDERSRRDGDAGRE